jgi:hypothetical protein
MAPTAKLLAMLDAPQRMPAAFSQDPLDRRLSMAPMMDWTDG